MKVDRRRIVAAALAAGACGAVAAAPAPASAQQRGGPDDVVSVYEVRFDGTVTYQQRKVFDAEHFEDEGTSFRVTVRGGGLTFRNRMVVRTLNTPDIVLGFPRTSTHQATDDGPVDCRDSGAAVTSGFAHLGPSDPLARGEGLVMFMPFGGVDISLRCTGPDGPDTGRLALGNVWQPELPGKPARAPPFGYVFSPFMTREPDPSSLRVPVDRTAPAKVCPHRDVYTRSCTARLQGTLVLTRTGGTPQAERGSGGGGRGRRAEAGRRARARRPGRNPRRARGRGRKG